MLGYEILDHPADIGIKVYGKTIEELFINAALGTTSLITDLDSISTKLKKEIIVKEKSIEELFINWLDEVIYLFDTEGFLAKNIVVETFHGAFLHANIEGEIFNKDKHEIKLYLKAVTYHQLEVKQLENKDWEARVYFDV
ncbi:MAG: archease [Candidatus Melainabacteria bacterium]|nr:archease [Candidatus Melainabacteria bacterium]